MNIEYLPKYYSLRKNILILDYSVNREETGVIRNGLPEDVEVSSLFIDTADSFPDDLIQKGFTHVIHTGSILSANEDAPFTDKAVAYINGLRDLGVWQMGICYGHQLVCRALLGAEAVRPSPKGFEVGWEDVNFTTKAIQLLKVRSTEKVWQHHFDEVVQMPEGSELLAMNSHSEVQAYVNFNQHLLGTQFHPEFNKISGDKYFRDDKLFIEKQGFNVDEMVKQNPSFDTTKVFFEFFLGH